MLKGHRWAGRGTARRADRDGAKISFTLLISTCFFPRSSSRSLISSHSLTLKKKIRSTFKIYEEEQEKKINGMLFLRCKIGC